MQDFIDDYKIIFNIDEDITFDTSLEDGEIKVIEKGYSINASKDPEVLERLGKIKLSVPSRKSFSQSNSNFSIFSTTG